jgi:hypothetical protein
MHSAIKQGYVAPIALQTRVAVVTLGINGPSGEPTAGYHLEA